MFPECWLFFSQTKFFLFPVLSGKSWRTLTLQHISKDTRQKASVRSSLTKISLPVAVRSAVLWQLSNVSVEQPQRSGAERSGGKCQTKPHNCCALTHSYARFISLIDINRTAHEMPNISRLQIFSSEIVIFTLRPSHDLNLGYKMWFISSEWLLARVSKLKLNRHASDMKPGLYFNTCAAVWRVHHSHEGRDYNQRWACLSLAVWARWRQGWVWDSVTYKVDPMLAAGRENTSHSCESPVATTYRPAWIHSAIYQSHQQKPEGRCAACYLTWLSGSSSAHYCTQTHSPVMIYCLSAYGITLEPSGQTAARCFMEENSAEHTPNWSPWVAAASSGRQMD